VPPDAVAQAQAEAICEVWPQHWDALEVFRGAETQWDVLVGSGGVFYQGLNYQKVEVVMGWLGVNGTRELFEQLKVMEAEAKTYLNDR